MSNICGAGFLRSVYGIVVTTGGAGVTGLALGGSNFFKSSCCFAGLAGFAAATGFSFVSLDMAAVVGCEGVEVVATWLFSGAIRFNSRKCATSAECALSLSRFMAMVPGA